MSSAPKDRIYWLDSNVLITAKNGPFRFSFAQAFWDALAEQAIRGRVRASKMVYEEIVKDDREDEVSRWLKQRRLNGLCVTPSRSVQINFRVIADHVHSRYRLHQAAKFLAGADPWVIAHASDDNGAVVTFETYQANSQRVKIPNVCNDHGVQWMNLYDMIEELGISFN